MRDGRRSAVGPAAALCALADLPDPGGRGFRLPGRAPFFVIRRGGRVFGYVNACPHRGTPLDWKPDTFLTPDGTLIQCSTHGARFRIDDGGCVAGPCMGQALATVRVEVEDGMLLLAADRPAERGVRRS